MISFHSLPHELREELFPELKGARNTEEWNTTFVKLDEKWEKIAEAADILNDAVNTSNDLTVSKMFNMCMTAQHRTLQQSTLKLIMRYIEFVASDEYETDERNWASKEVCQRLLKGFDWNGLTPSQCLPLI